MLKSIQNYIRIITFLVNCFQLLHFTCSAQFSLPGQRDTSFNFGGMPFSFFSPAINPQPGVGADNGLNTMGFLSDGKILIGGYFFTYNGVQRKGIARLLPEGSIDTTFNPGLGSNFPILHLRNQPDGKILIGGSFTEYNNVARNGIARIHENGNLDTTFDVGTGANNWVRSILLQPDGKIIIGGHFTSINGVPRNHIARLHPDGSIDTTFNPGNGANSFIYSMVLQPDGRILIGGLFNHYNGFFRRGIARINPNGSIDTTFDPGNVIATATGSTRVNSVALQPNGQVIIGGWFFTSFGGNSRVNLIRLNANGSLDTTFLIGTGTNEEVNAIDIQPDGKIVIGGFFTSYNGATATRIARINPNGSLDSTFSAGANLVVSSIHVRPDGKLLVGGTFNALNGVARGMIARIDSSGRIDNTFNPVTGANSFVYSLGLQPDGKSIIAGIFTQVNGAGRNRIARLNVDGSIDNSFQPGSGADGGIQTISIQPSGKILISGFFSSYNGFTRIGFARLNTDGSLDTSFNTAFSPNQIIFSIVTQPDGKIIAGGSISTFGSLTRRGLVRLNNDGSLDSSFNSANGALGTVRSIMIQSDQKILIAGDFSRYNNILRNRIARLNSNSSLDTSFNPGTGFNGMVNVIALQPDGKLLVGGEFTIFNGISRNRITRLNPNGSLDPTFNVGAGCNGAIMSIVVQPDGKIIITGDFTSYNGTTIQRIARLNADGSLDATFNSGSGANNAIFTSALQPDGKVLLGGSFTNYQGGNHFRIVRIHSPICLTLPNAPNASTPLNVCTGNSVTITPTGGGGNYRFYAAAFGGNPMFGGDGVTSFTTAPLLTPGSMTYHVASVSANGCESSTRTPITITVNARPDAPLVTQQLNVCEGATVTISPISGGARYRIYSDSVGGSPIPGGDGINSLSIPFITNSITYYIASLSANGCESNTRTSVRITVYPLPIVQIAQTGDSLVASITTGSFQWLLDGIEIAGATGISYRPLVSGIYSLRILSSEGCSSISNAIHFFATALPFSPEHGLLKWSVYPVPFEDHLSIRAEGAFSYSLIDARGATIQHGTTEKNQITLPTAELPTGIYMLKINILGQFQIRKLIKR